MESDARQRDLIDRRRLAADAAVDERTVQRYLTGQPIRLLSQARIERALAAERDRGRRG